MLKNTGQNHDGTFLKKKNKRLRKVLAPLASQLLSHRPLHYSKGRKASIRGLICGQHEVDCSLVPTPFALLKIRLIHIHCRKFGKMQKSMKKMEMTQRATIPLTFLTAERKANTKIKRAAKCSKISWFLFT